MDLHLSQVGTPQHQTVLSYKIKSERYTRVKCELSDLLWPSIFASLLRDVHCQPRNVTVSSSCQSEYFDQHLRGAAPPSQHAHVPQNSAVLIYCCPQSIDGQLPLIEVPSRFLVGSSTPLRKVA